MFADRNQAPDIATAEKPDVSRRDFRSGYVPNSMQTEDIPLQTDETTFVSLPEPPTGV